MPHASTFTRTCPGSGSGMSRSTNSKSPPGLLICAAFIFVLIKCFYLSIALSPFPIFILIDFHPQHLTVKPAAVKSLPFQLTQLRRVEIVSEIARSEERRVGKECRSG